MSDPTANAPVPEAAPVVEPAAVTSVPDAVAAEPIEYTPESVKRLRDEAAGYRTKLTPFEEAYQGYNEDEIATLLEVARVLKADPIAAAEWMENAAREIKGVQEAAPAAPAPAVDDPSRPLTAAEVQALLDERDRTKAEERARVESIESIDREVRELGYDPSDSWGLRVMQLAAYQTQGDLKAAHEIVQGEKQKIIDDYVATLAEQGGAAGVTPAAGGIPSGERSIRTLDDAAAAMRERLSRVM